MATCTRLTCEDLRGQVCLDPRACSLRIPTHLVADGSFEVHDRHACENLGETWIRKSVGIVWT